VPIGTPSSKKVPIGTRGRLGIADNVVNVQDATHISSAAGALWPTIFQNAGARGSLTW